jgi:hypothetical protein
LQRTNGDADQFRNFLTPSSALDQILDLVDPLGGEFDLPHHDLFQFFSFS